MRLLLARGADVDAPAARVAGFTALQGACLAGEGEVARVLVEEVGAAGAGAGVGAGADVNAPGSWLHGGTALHAAVAGGQLAIVRWLLARGADPNGVAGGRRQTPVQSAYVVGRRDMVAVLEEAGAVGPRAGGRMLFGTARMKAWSRGDIEAGAGL